MCCFSIYKFAITARFAEKKKIRANVYFLLLRVSIFHEPKTGTPGGGGGVLIAIVDGGGGDARDRNTPRTYDRRADL